MLLGNDKVKTAVIDAILSLVRVTAALGLANAALVIGLTGKHVGPAGPAVDSETNAWRLPLVA